MKKIADVSGEILHRHFGEDSFKEFKDLPEIDESVIVTYSPLKRVKTSFEFMFNNFITKSKRSTVIIGIKGLSAKDAADDIEHAIKYIKKFKHNDLFVYFHTRCHIKMMAADGVMYLGTQNVAGTSNSFIENSDKNFREIYNDHELIFRVKDPSGVNAKRVLGELKSDRYSCFIVRDPVGDVYFPTEKIFILYKQEVIRSDFEFMKEELNRIGEYKEKVLRYDVDPEIPSHRESFDLLSSLFREQDRRLQFYRAKEIIEYCFGDYFDDVAFSNPWKNIEESIENVRDSLRLSLKNEDVDKAISMLERARMDDFECVDGCFNHFMDRVVYEVCDADLTVDSVTYLDYKFDVVVDKVLSSPGEYELHELMDNDGCVTLESAKNAVSHKIISENDQMAALSEEINCIFVGVATMILDFFVKESTMRIDEARNFWENKLSESMPRL